MDKKLIEQINQKSIKAFDYWYRIYHGTGSEFIDYNGIIYLKIRFSEQWKIPQDEIALRLANCWRKHNPELNEAVGFVATLYFAFIGCVHEVPER